MRTRIIILIVALLLGGLAAVMAARYLSDARTKLSAESQPIEVLVAQEDVPRGITSEELVRQGMIKLEEVPKRFVAADAVSSARAIEGQVLATPLSKGQQVTAAQFQVPSTAGLAYSIAKDQEAISIPIDAVKGVSGLVKPGDHIALYVTFSPGPTGEPTLTKQLFGDVKVLAVGASLQSEAQPAQAGGGIGGAQQQAAPQAATFTLAVTAADAEKLVFAELNGSIWCSLLPANSVETPATKGQTLQTVLR